MIRQKHLVALMFAGLAAAPAWAAPVDQLRCVDDRLNDDQRAAIASLFAEQPDNPKDAVKHPQGSAAAAKNLTYALSSCSNQFAWTHPQQDAASQYLIGSGQLARIKLRHDVGWSNSLERIAPFVIAQLDSAGQLEVPRRASGEKTGAADAESKANDLRAHARAIIMASAISNSKGAVKSADEDEVIAFYRAWKKVELARRAFGSLSGY